MPLFRRGRIFGSCIMGTPRTKDGKIVESALVNFSHFLRPIWPKYCKIFLASGAEPPTPSVFSWDRGDQKIWPRVPPSYFGGSARPWTNRFHHRLFLSNENEARLFDVYFVMFTSLIIATRCVLTCSNRNHRIRRGWHRILGRRRHSSPFSFFFQLARIVLTWSWVGVCLTDHPAPLWVGKILMRFVHFSYSRVLIEKGARGVKTLRSNFEEQELVN